MWWLITAVVCTIIGLVSAMGIAATVTIDDDSNGPLRSFVGITAFIVVVLYVLANLAVYGETMPYAEREKGKSRDLRRSRSILRTRQWDFLPTVCRR